MAKQKISQNRIRRCSLTAEGYIYVVIICFISIGAILRNVNLLILSTGVLVAPLIFNWRVCVANLRSLQAKRVVPDRVHAQSSINVLWTCNNTGGRLTARNVVIRDRIDSQNRTSKKSLLRRLFRSSKDPGENLSDHDAMNWNDVSEYAVVSFPSINKFDPGIASYQCFFPGRGKFMLGPAEIQTSFPFGLVRCRIPLLEQETVYVAPPLGKLHPTWERRIDSRDVGAEAQTRRKGFENDEFYALRKWRSGDSQKHIHWRSTAKMGYPMVREFDQPNDRDFALLLDLNYDDEVSRSKCEVILSFATTAISQLASDVQGQLALSICGKKDDLVSGRQNLATHQRAMQKLAVARPTENPHIESNVVDLASQISAGTPIHCLSTRSEPKWLSDISSETSPALTAIRNQIRWIHVDSAEFKELFSIDFDGLESPQPKTSQ